MKLKNYLLLLICVVVVYTLSLSALSQDSKDQKTIRNIYDVALTDSRCYDWLEHICLKIGHRFTGSENAERAVEYTQSMLDTLHLDSVWLQPVMVPKWVRGQKEDVKILYSKIRKVTPLNALALGGSVGTPEGGMSASVVEVKSWSALDSLGEEGVKGKIVFYNRPMDPRHIHTFSSYGCAVDQRVQGASRASAYGAIGVLVRSMGLKIDDFPHTGGLWYDSTHTLIPAVAISTQGAEELSEALQLDPELKVRMEMNCRTYPDVLSYNVIGEIRGTEAPDTIILVGGHLDSWDVGHGAHDDGAGCVQSMDVLRYLQAVEYKPRYTIRCVLFMNEENGLRGAKEYAREAKRKGEHHLCAIESDSGGFAPRGFSFDASTSVLSEKFEKIKAWESLLEPYGLGIWKGGSGADVGPLKDQMGMLCGYKPDSQRYFDFHHTAADVFDAVNQRELEMGAASMTSLVYLLDKYGL